MGNTPPVKLPDDINDPFFIPALKRQLLELFNFIDYQNIKPSGVKSANILSLATTKLTGAVPQANLNIADRGWVQTCAFSVTDADTVAWGAGVFTSADGTAYNITGANTGNMAAKTYIYLDTAVSTTVYQITTTATTAVGAGKVLIAVAQNGTTEATFLVLQGQGGKNIDAAEIVAGSVTANEIATGAIITAKLAALAVTANELAANAVTAAKILAGAITADKITAGEFTAAQLLDNGDFEDWINGTAVAPYGWTLAGAGVTQRESSIVKLGTYSAYTNNAVGDSGYLYQDIHILKGIPYWKGKAVTLSCWVYTNASNRVRIIINDGVGATNSNFHSGGSNWEYLTVTHTVSGTATQVRIALMTETGTSIDAYFDGAMCVEGSYAMPYYPKSYSQGWVNQTRKYIIPPCSWTPYGSVIDWRGYTGTYLQLWNSPLTAEFNCPVNLPNGAIVTSFNVYYYRDDASSAGSANLYRVSLTGSSSAMASVTFTSTAGDANIEDISISNATIDNNNYFYIGHCSMTTNDSIADVYLFAVVITYYLTSPLP